MNTDPTITAITVQKTIVRKGRQQASLGKLLPLKYGKGLPERTRDSSGKHPVFGSSGMVGVHTSALTDGPTLMVGRKGNVGAIHYSPVPCWPIDTVYYVETPAGHNLRYYKYLLESLNLARLERSTSIPSLSRDDYNAIEVSIAPPEEQDEIVAEIEKQFSRLDEAITNLKRVKANLKRYKASILKNAIEGRLVPTEAELARCEDRDYETGAQFVQSILETRRDRWDGKGKFKEPRVPLTEDLSTLPDAWTWATLPQLGELNRGKSKHRPRNDSALYGGPYPFIQTGDIRRSDGTITEYRQTYSEFGLKQSRLWPIDTLCITIAANIAETAILKLEACFPDSVVGFIAERGYPSTEYIEYFLRTAKDHLSRFASATAQKNINLEVLECIAIPIPPIAEQKRIVAEVDRLLSIASKVDAQLVQNLLQAEHLRSAVLLNVFGQYRLEGVRFTDKHTKQQMKKRPLPSLPTARKSEAEDHRHDLMEILMKYPNGMSAETLFQEAGYRGDQVDTFYRDLARLSEKITQELPTSDAKNWPASGPMSIQIKT